MNQKKFILIIEDEPAVQKNLSERLESEGYETFVYTTAEKAIDGGLCAMASAAIVDINLPGMNGLDAVNILKKQNGMLPVIFLTAYSDVKFRLQGFDAGADDYIIKPFFIDEFVARLKTLLKRYEMIPGSSSNYVVADLEIDVRTKTVLRDNVLIRLSSTEFNLLVLLAEANGRPVRKDEMIKKIWKEKYHVGENTIEVYINLIRNKIDKGHDHKLIHTKAGFGYYLSS